MAAEEKARINREKKEFEKEAKRQKENQVRWKA